MKKLTLTLALTTLLASSVSYASAPNDDLIREVCQVKSGGKFLTNVFIEGFEAIANNDTSLVQVNFNIDGEEISSKIVDTSNAADSFGNTLMSKMLTIAYNNHKSVSMCIEGDAVTMVAL